jgi:serine/threonine protein kinase/WD40 repeat protein
VASPAETTSGTADGESPLMRRAGNIFFAVRELGLPERDDAIVKACEGNQELEDLVRLLLKGSESPLPIEALADEVRAASESVAPTGDKPGTPGGGTHGTIIGNYRLLERLGEGGFGVVYMAQQDQPVRRRVALKIVKLGMDTKQVVARFEAERQALALMDHPSIAKVFDAGSTSTGRPYFVMELVKGLPITEYCDLRKLDIRDRLTLVTQVCDALQHAHQRGVIHRDIKPSNVLVSTIEGDKPLPKIIDFGIAKATSARLTEKTVFTEFRQMVGTPEYMSPEQSGGVGGEHDDVDTRTDVYSTGVLMYELLVGATPFDSKRLRSAAFGELQRIIREEDPPKPSTRLSGQRNMLATVAGQRATQPARLESTIRGELDWIVMKALEKDRQRRYESASAMGADIQRYLSGHAVLAAPPNAWYRARKFVRRNRAAVVAASLIAVALVVGLIGTSLGFFRAEAQRKLAVSERDRADANAAEARTNEATALRRAYSANLMAASTAVSELQFASARAALEAAPESLRGWEWRVLHERLETSVRSLKIAPQPLSDLVSDLIMHPDGRSFLTLEGTSNPVARRWDLATGRELQRIPQPVPPGRFGHWAAMSIDGRQLTTFPVGVMDQTADFAVDLWDLDSGQRVRTAKIPFVSRGRADLCALPDGSRLIVGTATDIRSVDTTSGQVMARQATDHFEVPLAISRDSRLVASIIDQIPIGRITVRDADSLEQQALLEGHTGYPKSTSFSTDGRWLVSSADDSSARVWNLMATPPTSIVLRHPYSVLNARFSPDASLVATCGVDRAVRVWDRATGRLLNTYATDAVNPSLIMFTPDSRFVVACEDNGTVRFWDLAAESVPVLRGHRSIVSRARWANPNAGLIVSSSWEGVEGSLGTVRIWDADSGDQVGAFEGRPGDIVYAMAVSADGRLAATGITDHRDNMRGQVARREAKPARVEVIDLATGRVRTAPPKHQRVLWMAFAPDARTLLFYESPINLNARLNIMDTRTGEVLRTRDLGVNIEWSFDLSPDGRTIAATDRPVDTAEADQNQPRPVLLLDAQTLDTVRQIDGVPGVNFSIAFNRDGTRLALGDGDGILRLVDIASGKLLASMTGHGMRILDIAFSPDGSRIASAGVDRRVRIWNAATFEKLAVFAGHEGHIGDLDWDATGERLVSCSGDSTVRLWEPRTLRDRVAAQDARRTALTLVEPKVEQWFAELKEPEAVIARIRADAGLSPLERKTALQVVLHRGLAANR